VLRRLEMANQIVVFERRGRQNNRVQRDGDDRQPPPPANRSSASHWFDNTPNNRCGVRGAECEVRVRGAECEVRVRDAECEVPECQVRNCQVRKCGSANARAVAR
jgi:hypothetical protein